MIPVVLIKLLNYLNDGTKTESYTRRSTRMNPFEEVIKEPHPLIDADKSFMNDQFAVDVKFENKEAGIDGMLWLSIKRKDKNWIHDWRLLQKIKNLIAGEEREGCEIFPAESRLVDTSNQYHIFVLPKGERFPWGYEGRAIVGERKGGWNNGAGQRAFKPKDKPEDCLTPEEADIKTQELMKK